MFLAKKMPKKFFPQERIVRHVYSEENYNTKTKQLKSNFLGFALNVKSEKYELSCNRFEMESINHCHTIGALRSLPPKKSITGLPAAQYHLFLRMKTIQYFIVQCITSHT